MHRISILWNAPKNIFEWNEKFLRTRFAGSWRKRHSVYLFYVLIRAQKNVSSWSSGLRRSKKAVIFCPDILLEHFFEWWDFFASFLHKMFAPLKICWMFFRSFMWKTSFWFPLFYYLYILPGAPLYNQIWNLFRPVKFIGTFFRFLQNFS